MRIIFMGTPEFAVPALERLIGHGYEVAAVYTQPDKAAAAGHCRRGRRRSRRRRCRIS